MRTQFTLLLLSVMLILSSTSCGSDNIIEGYEITKPTEDTRLIPVSFSLDGMVIDITPFTSKSTENKLPSNIKEILYFVHLNRKGEGTDSLYKFRVLNKTELTSVILDTLPKGNYRFSFIAMSDTTVATEKKNVREVIIEECIYPTVFIVHNQLTIPGLASWSRLPSIEMFANTIDLTIADINPSPEITLFRKTSQLQLTIKDANLIPDSIESLGLYITPYNYNLMNFRYYPHQDKFQGTLSSTGSILLGDLLSNTTDIKNLDKKPLIINTYPCIGGSKDKLRLTLRAFNKKGNLVLSKVMDVPLVSNKITKMSGYLFDARNLGFNITINEDWNGEIISELE